MSAVKLLNIFKQTRHAIHAIKPALAARVKVASVSALNRMKIKVISESMQDKGNIILVTAKTTERNIEIQIEPISSNTTRTICCKAFYVFI